MTDFCKSCDAKITDRGVLGSSNPRYDWTKIKIVNFINGTSLDELCEECGMYIVDDTIGKLQSEAERCQAYVKYNIIDFPMMTISHVPPGAKCRIKAMVTANVTVGTGLFSEMSQGFSEPDSKVRQ